MRLVQGKIFLQNDPIHAVCPTLPLKQLYILITLTSTILEAMPQLDLSCCTVILSLLARIEYPPMRCQQCGPLTVA